MKEKDIKEGVGSMWYSSVDLLALIILQEIDLGEESHYNYFMRNFPELDDFPLKYDN